MLGKWLAKRRRRSAARAVLADAGQFFYLMNYREQYSELPNRLLESSEFLVELYLFRFWVTQCAFRILLRPDVTDEEVLRSLFPVGMDLGYNAFHGMQRLAGRSLPVGLDAGTVQNIFQGYDAEFVGGRSESDPLALAPLAVHFGGRVGLTKAPEILAYIGQKTHDQILAIGALIDSARRE